MLHPEMTPWHGRDDTPSEGQLAVRWHQSVTTWNLHAPPGLVLLGFASDEGVRRNAGRIGAAGAPKALRQSMSNLAFHGSCPIYDAGNVDVVNNDLESAQRELSSRISTILKSGNTPLIIGGGHETAWGTFQGITSHQSVNNLGIINIDAHFDLRPGIQVHSGTPFSQMADWLARHRYPFNYLALGISEAANTQALFERARSLNTNWVLDEELSIFRFEQTVSKLNQFFDKVDALYLSVDLDVLPISIMRAVSAPAALGVPFEVVLYLIKLIASSGKLLLADIVEYNPELDTNQTDGRVAARMIWHLVRHWSPLRDTHD